MKYLRIFEGAGETECAKLKDFCEMYLAYLIDDGFGVNVTKERPFIKSMAIRINPPRSISWNQIKDSFIPFLNMLLKDYNIGIYPTQGRSFHKSWLDSTVSFSIIKSSKDSNDQNIDISKLLNDEIKNIDRIYMITIIVHTKE